MVCCTSDDVLYSVGNKGRTLGEVLGKERILADIFSNHLHMVMLGSCSLWVRGMSDFSDSSGQCTWLMACARQTASTLLPVGCYNLDQMILKISLRKTVYEQPSLKA
jgi:hypothetical protein